MQMQSYTAVTIKCSEQHVVIDCSLVETRISCKVSLLRAEVKASSDNLINLHLCYYSAAVCAVRVCPIRAGNI